MKATEDSYAAELAYQMARRQVPLLAASIEAAGSVLSLEDDVDALRVVEFSFAIYDGVIQELDRRKELARCPKT